MVFNPLPNLGKAAKFYSPFVEPSGQGFQFDPAALALFTAMTVPPTAARMQLINTTIINLKDTGVWTQLDVLYFLAAHDAQAARLNWKSPGGAFDAVAVNSPTFAVDRGYTGNGSNSRLRTNYTPSTNAVAQTQNNASLLIWSLTNSASNSADAGSLTAPRSYVVARLGSGIAAQVSLNNATQDNVTIATSLGLIGVSRVSSTVERAWQNGVQLGVDVSNTSTGLASQEQWVLGANASDFSTRQIALAAFGASLVGLENSFYNICLSYMQAVGAA